MNAFLGEAGITESAGRRSAMLRIIVISLFAFYLLYLFSLQVIRSSEYKSKAKAVAQSITVIPAQRGEIYDRNYTVPLVLNTDSFAIDIIPAELPGNLRDTVFGKLSQILNISTADIAKKIPPAYYHLYQPIEIRESVSYETIAMIAERIDEFPGITWHNKPVRNYLETGALSHVIGYVGDITREEIQMLFNQGYQSGDVIGKTGIEKQYDIVLRGKEGKNYRTVDVKGRKVEEYEEAVDPPEMGKNLVLTIDRNIQKICEKALGDRMGSIVVLRPSSGEVLAMVSFPWFDPNLFQNEAGNTEFVNLINNPNNPLINRSIQSSYPPASAFKIIMETGIIEEEAFPQDKTVDCSGEINFGDRVFRCWIRKPGHGPLDLQGALAQSCDVYFWTVGRENLGIERIVSYAKEFGFGVNTEIDLPSEVPGFVPTPQWKERRFHEKWLGGDTLNMAIGQGYLLVTPIQMADMVAMVVNEGTIYTPHMVKEIRDPSSGAIVKKTEYQVLLKSRIRDTTFKAVKENMRAVVVEGTARLPVNTKAVKIAGKTGTGEVGLRDRWHSWFASYAPYDAANPEDVIVVVVIVEASNQWEWWAPYASNIIYQAIFANQSYEDAVVALDLQFAQPQSERRE